MYENVWSRVWVGEGLSEEVKVSVHYGTALQHRARGSVSTLGRYKCMYADDLVIIADFMEECLRRLLTLKEGMERKGLRVDAGKTKIMICGIGLDLY